MTRDALDNRIQEPAGTNQSSFEGAGDHSHSLPVIDTHCHVLPGIDDGSKNVQESLDMLHQMKAQGVDIVVATPHYYAKRRTIDEFLEQRQCAYEALKPYLDDICPQIVLGAEVAFHFDISRAEGLEKLCIEGTNTLLLEMPKRTPWSDYELNEIQDIVNNRDLEVVIAHYERYKDSQAKNPCYADMLDLPVYIQVNAEDLLGLFAGKESLRLFKDGYAHLLGSDSHNTKDRLPNLDKGRQIIKKKLGDEKLEEIDQLGKKLVLGQ